MSSPKRPSDRYEAVGLRQNPFSAAQERDKSSTEIRDLFVSRSLPDPPAPGSRTLIQVIGPKGAGKTTHLDWWRTIHPGPLHYIPRAPYRARWAQPPLVKASFREAIVYGDEIDRMPKPLRSRWFRHLSQRRATLIIGTHVDLHQLGERSGFEVITHQLETLDLATLREIIDKRFSAFALDGGASIGFDDDELERILTESGGNPRESEAICHSLLAAKLIR